MQKWFVHRIIIYLSFVMLFSPLTLQGQFFLYSETPIDIDARFSMHSIEAAAKESFFNILKIKNNSNRSENLVLNITVPQGWKVIGNERVEIQISPYDSLLVPIRIAIGGIVRGDIGYSVIASITDTRGSTVKNEYCFVKVPRKIDLTAKVLDRIAYLDPVTGQSEFTIHIDNKGNRDEPVNVILDGKSYLGVGKLGQSIISEDIIVKPYSDSLLGFNISLKTEQTFQRSSFALDVEISTSDTTLKNIVWFRKLDSYFFNSIPENDKPLIFQITGQGLLDANRKPSISSNIQGRILFTGERDFYYYYRNFSSRKPEDFYLHNRMYVGSKFGKWNFELGDNYRFFESKIIGRGGYVEYTSKQFNSQIVANQELRSKTQNYGCFIKYNFLPKVYVRAGGTYSQNNITDFKSLMGLIGGGTTINNNHSLYSHIALNKVERDLDGKNSHNELGADIRYRSKIDKINNYFQVKYTSPLFYGPQSGVLRIYGRSQYQINPRNRFSLYYTENQSNKPFIENKITTRTQINVRRQSRVEYTYLATPNIQVYGGPSIEFFQYKGLTYFPNDGYFSSINYKFVMGARIKNPFGSLVIAPKYEVARANILSNPFDTLESNINKNKFNYQYFSLNLMSKYVNLLAFYTSGPRSGLDQVAYSYLSRQVRKLQLIPSYDRFIFKDILRTYLGLSYSNDIVSGSSYSNLTGQIFWYLPYSWRIHTLMVYTVQSRTSAQDVVEKYQNFYLEAGIRKDFEFSQPRVKYYDIDLLFFKDFNGNHIQDINEPGIKNILVNFSKIDSDVNGRIPGEVFSTELLSDNLGRIELTRIPEGRYKVQYNPVGKDAGTFSKGSDDMIINVNHSGYYFFPFVEKNKVFGKIILNRSKLSGLGRLDVSNIRITATDSQGRTYSTLTDKNGSFTLFAPVTDEYVLTINNIYYENFDLRQNNFLVQFNGYKQFEVNFVFDEKVRRINFAVTPEGEGITGVQQVRRTNISGTIKDANSQNPVRARVNLVNTRTNSIVTSTFSSATNGEYTLSFMSGDNYLLEVVADDYWYLSENLVLNQVTTFMSITRDVLLRPIAVGSKIELNIKFGPNSDFLAPESVAEMNRLLRLVRQNVSVKLEVQGHCDDIEALQRPEIALDRARAVAKYLIENGVSNIEVKSLGNTVPISANDTEEGRSRNRRVDVEVVSK